MIRLARIYILILFLLTLFFRVQSAYTIEGVPSGAAEGGELVVHVMDVDHGDAILIQTPDGKNILIDSGVSKEVWSQGDMGEIVVIPYLRALGIYAIDMLIISHAHDDHIGGMPYLIEHIEVKEVVDSGYPHSTQAYRNLLRLIQKKQIAYRKVRAGDILPFGKHIKARVLHPPHTKYRWGKRAKVNNYSIVIRMVYGDVSFLFTGDLEKEGERDVLRAGYSVRSRILKVGHHGSTTSTTRMFVNAVRPEVAIVSCGERPKFRRRKPCRNLRSVGTKIYRTDLNGTVIVRTDGKIYSVETEEQ